MENGSIKRTLTWPKSIPKHRLLHPASMCLRLLVPSVFQQSRSCSPPVLLCLHCVLLVLAGPQTTRTARPQLAAVCPSPSQLGRSLLQFDPGSHPCQPPSGSSNKPLRCRHLAVGAPREIDGGADERAPARSQVNTAPSGAAHQHFPAGAGAKSISIRSMHHGGMGA